MSIARLGEVLVEITAANRSDDTTSPTGVAD
jgi:hypothetical protein